QLDLGDLADLRLGDASDLRPIRLTRSLLDTGLLLQKHRGRRRLRDEGERLVREDGDLDGENRPRFLLGSCVELLHERHDVDALRAQRRTNRWRRRRLPRGDLQLHESRDFLRHSTSLRVRTVRVNPRPNSHWCLTSEWWLTVRGTGHWVRGRLSVPFLCPVPRLVRSQLQLIQFD